VLDIMLCGASDISEVRNEFIRVVNAVGGRPWNYLDGQMRYQNTLSSSYVRNSRQTVRDAHVCVFVVVRRIGEITWQTEYHQAVNMGKCVLIFCHDETYQRYRMLSRHVDDLNALSDENRALIEVMSDLESGRQQTVVPYQPGSFEEVLRSELAKQFAMALDGAEHRAGRAAVVGLLSDPDALRSEDLVTVTEIAADEFEDKTFRRQAILALADRQAADEDLVRHLIRSAEQGVQRLTIQLLPRLYRQRPPDLELLDLVVATANLADDVGVMRRAIPALCELDFSLAANALAALELTDIGSRRRLAQALEQHERLVDDGNRAAVVNLLNRCVDVAHEADWKQRCRAFVRRLVIG
jgi:hypothetical protein